MADSNAKPTAAPVNKASEDTSASAPATADTTNTSAAVAAATTPTTDVDTTAATNDTPDTTDTTEPTEVEVKESMKRPELNAIATEAGLVNVKNYKDKATVVSAIERVRAGEDVAAIDAEFAPVEDDKGDDADVDVEVTAPFYDLQTDRNRSAGEKYKTTEARATELRSRNLVK